MYEGIYKQIKINVCYIVFYITLAKNLKQNNMTQEFTYYTKTQGEKQVLLFDGLIHGYYLVEVNCIHGMSDKDKKYKFNTQVEANKKFESIKKRVNS